MADDPEKPQPPDDLATRLAKLETDLAAEREEKAAMRQTLQTLEADRRGASGGDRPPAPAGSRLSRERAQAIADRLGGEWTAANVQQNWPVFEAFVGELAEPLLRGVNGIADVVDLVHTRQEDAKFGEIQSDVDKVREEHVSRGQFITRRQAAAIVRARRLEDPKYRDELADQRLKEREEEQARRAAEETAATTEGAGRAPTQTAGPSPTKGQRPKLDDPETFDRLPLEEKRKQLVDAGIQF